MKPPSASSWLAAAAITAALVSVISFGLPGRLAHYYSPGGANFLIYETKVTTSSTSTSGAMAASTVNVSGSIGGREGYGSTNETTIVTTNDESVPRRPQSSSTAAAAPPPRDRRRRRREDGSGFAACLLVKDENNRLIEWLAYHYHVLPLRHLVIAVDDDSVTSPTPILDRWRDRTNMEIIQWSDKDYVKRHVSDVPLLNRQQQFIPACASYHKRSNRTWLALHDVDEYITFNTPGGNDEPKTKFKAGEAELEEAGRARDPNFLSLRQRRMKARKRLPHVGGNTTVLDFIEEHGDSSLWFNDTCVTMPRLLFGAVDSPSDVLARSNADELLGINSTRFNTLRFFHRAKKGEFNHNGWGKVVVDVSRIPNDTLEKLVNNPHRPFDVCKRAFIRYETVFLRCHHYVGSWEEYSFKDDARRSREMFDTKGNISMGTTYDMQPWLRGFVDEVGYDDARYLLDGVGELRREW